MIASRVRSRLARTGLLARILALVSLGLVAAVVGFVLLSMQAMRESTAKTLEERLLMTQATAQELGYRLREMAEVAAVEAVRLPTEGGVHTDETRSAWRALRFQFGAGVKRIVAVSSDGRTLWTSPYDEDLIGLDLSGVPGVREALEAGQVAIDESDSSHIPPVLLDSQSTTPTVSIFSPVHSARGGLVLIVVDLNEHGTSDLLRRIVLGQTGYTEVVGRDGRVLASTRVDRLGVMSDHQGDFSSLIGKGRATVGTCHDCHWQPPSGQLTQDTIAFAPVPQTSLAVVVRQSSAETFALSTALFQRALVFAAVTLVVGLGLSWLIVGRLVQPVKVLTGACRRIAEGDLSEPTPPMPGGEMTVLANAFETMRVRLKASQEEIRRWGHELEEKVQARTAELLETRDSLQRSHDFLTTLFDSVEDRLAVIDKDYRVVEANRAVQRSLGEGRSAVGETCSVAFHGAEGQCELQHGACPARAGWRTGQTARAIEVHLDESGHATYLDIIASPITDGQSHVVNVLEVARDITESKRLEDQVLRTGEELSALVSLSSAIACSMDLRAMLGLALDHVLALLDSAAGGIVVDSSRDDADPTVVARGLDEQEIRKLARAGYWPKDRMEVSKLCWNERDVLCVPIATSERVLGQMFISCPSERCMAATQLQLLVSIGSQLAVAIENARLYEAVRAKEEAISTFMRKYIAAQEEERRRIARELHDETAQSLTALSIAVETALQAPVSDAAEVKTLLEPARSLTERVSREIDRIIHDLRPSLLDDLGLIEAIGWYADNRLKPLGVQVTFETIGSERRLPSELETALFRVAQEAMSNIARHARAENVSLTLEFGPDYVALEVEDDGCGFDVESTLARGQDGSGGDESPFGLLGMSERVSLIGGTLSVESRPGQGTSVQARVTAEPR